MTDRASPLPTWWVQGFWTPVGSGESIQSKGSTDPFVTQLTRFVSLRQAAPPAAAAGQRDPQANLLLAGAGNDPALRALARLIIGQSRLAWRLAGAWEWLDSAEQDAARHADPRSYLHLQRAHVTLRELPLFDRPRSACQSLTALLREAETIRYLRVGR